MHIPDGFMNMSTALGTGAVGAGGLALSLGKLRQDLGDRAAPLMGVTAAAVFSAQMLNFPVTTGTSGHLIGGVLAAVLLGPWAGVVVVSAVLIVQCFLYQDGGVLALGANIVNMALIGSLVGYCIYAPIRRMIQGPKGIVVGAVIAAWFSVLLAAIACSFQLAASGTYALRPTLTAMIGVHVFIGIGEAIITGLAIAFVLKTRPDIIHGEPPKLTNGRLEQAAQVVVGGLAIALVLAVFLSPWASSLPDGLEWSAEQVASTTNPASRETVDAPTVSFAAPIPDYEFPGIQSAAMATSVAGMIGTLITFGFAFSIGHSVRWQSPPGSIVNAL
ncbi:MAG: energy-coupling factor ABC transporter permease [Planctomycetota bacterium]